MEIKNIAIFFIIIFPLIQEVNTIDIHLLNNINEACILEINQNIYYYFYTSLTDVKVNEHISYFISKEITHFSISYSFLENDNYKDISDSNINNYYFNLTLGIFDRFNFFKTIFKTNNNQKGLLLKMKIISYNNSTSTLFNISRIHLTFVKPNSFTKQISSNQINYFYLNEDYILQYDILIFSSYAKKRIKQYYFDISIIYEFSKKYNFLFYNDKTKSHYILEISTNENENIFFNIKFFPKNILIIGREIQENTIENNMHQIQLPYPNNEVYFLGRNKYYNYFLKNISGVYEAEYIYLDDINNLEDIFPDKDNKMKPLIDNIMFEEEKSLALMHFKRVNNSQNLILLVSINSKTTPSIFDRGGFYFYLIEKKISKIINRIYDDKNITIFSEYLGCQLEDKEEIRIYLKDKILLKLNKTIKNGQFDIEISTTTKLNYYAYSDKNCCVLFKFGNHKLQVNDTIKESYNNTMQTEIIYKYPKIEENYHYHFYFYFYYYGTVHVRNPDCSFYYTDYNFLSHDENVNDYYNILMNPYNALEKNDNLTYVISCYYYHTKDPIYFNIIKLKQNEAILDKFFLTEKFSEYKFPLITKPTQLLIQIFGYFNHLEDNMPLLYIGNHIKKLERYANIIFVPNGTFPQIVINGEAMALKVSYINNEVDIYSRINARNRGFDISSGESGIYELSIKPLLYDENIHYTIHACINGDIYNTKEISFYQRIIENFGNISINTTFIKNSLDVFNYTFNAEDKINSSYNYFILVAKDIKTGYTVISGANYCNYNYYKKNNTTLIIILISAFIILAIVVIIIFVLKRRKNRNNKEFNIGEQGKLME